MRRQKYSTVQSGLSLVLLLALAGVGTGCIALAVAGAAAVGTVAYAKGDLETILEEDINTIYAASKEALAELEIRITGTDKDLLSAVIRAEGAEDKKITIRLKRIEQGRLVKLTIRVGVFGEKTLSEIIYDKIQKNLQKTATL